MNRAADTMSVLYSPGSILAVLQERDEDEDCVSDTTLQYLLLLLSKVALNTLVLSFWLRSISKTLLGLYSISIYLADLLLIGAVSWAWWTWRNYGTHQVMCWSLSHGSSVYALLPLPMFLAGALDCATQKHRRLGETSSGRTAVHCAVVLLMWTLAGFYSNCYTNSELITIRYKKGVTALVCSVQGSPVVNNFSWIVFICVGVTLLLYCRKLPHWIRFANKMAKQRTCTRSMSDLAYSGKLDRIESQADEKAHVANLQNRPPLSISLVLCYALSWTPYLLMSTVCDLLGYEVPAYASVNLLWTACANSLLVGVAFWYRSNKHGPFCPVPDDICPWGFFWNLSKENGQYTASMKVHDGQD